MPDEVHDDDAQRILVEFEKSFLSSLVVGGCSQVNNSIVFDFELLEEFD